MSFWDAVPAPAFLFAHSRLCFHFCSCQLDKLLPCPWPCLHWTVFTCLLPHYLSRQFWDFQPLILTLSTLLANQVVFTCSFLYPLSSLFNVCQSAQLPVFYLFYYLNCQVCELWSSKNLPTFHNFIFLAIFHDLQSGSSSQF